MRFEHDRRYDMGQTSKASRSCHARNPHRIVLLPSSVSTGERAELGQLWSRRAGTGETTGHHLHRPWTTRGAASHRGRNRPSPALSAYVIEPVGFIERCCMDHAGGELAAAAQQQMARWRRLQTSGTERPGQGHGERPSRVAAVDQTGAVSFVTVAG